MGHSGAGSGCIGCWKPSQPRAIMVNKLSWGLATETTHWRAPFFSSACPLSTEHCSLGLKQGLILIAEMPLLRADQKAARRKWKKWCVCGLTDQCAHTVPSADIGFLIKGHFSRKLTIFQRSVLDFKMFFFYAPDSQHFQSFVNSWRLETCLCWVINCSQHPQIVSYRK